MSENLQGKKTVERHPTTKYTHPHIYLECLKIWGGNSKTLQVAFMSVLYESLRSFFSNQTSCAYQKDWPVQAFPWTWKIQRTQVIHFIELHYTALEQQLSKRGPQTSSQQHVGTCQPCIRSALPKFCRNFGVWPSNPSRGFWPGVTILQRRPFHSSYILIVIGAHKGHLYPAGAPSFSSVPKADKSFPLTTPSPSTSKLAQNSLFPSRYKRLSLKG